MSSSIDSGASMEDYRKGIESDCPKSSDGQHKWEKFGLWPSICKECKLCGKKIYTK